MVKIKTSQSAKDTFLLILDGILAPLALFLVFGQLWGLIMLEGSFVENARTLMLGDIRQAWELYVISIGLLVLWAFIRVKIRRNERRDQEEIVNLLKEIRDNLADKEKSDDKSKL